MLVTVRVERVKQSNVLTSPSLDLLFHSPSRALRAAFKNLLSPD